MTIAGLEDKSRDKLINSFIQIFDKYLIDYKNSVSVYFHKKELNFEILPYGNESLDNLDDKISCLQNTLKKCCWSQDELIHLQSLNDILHVKLHESEEKLFTQENFRFYCKLGEMEEKLQLKSKEYRKNLFQAFLSKLKKTPNNTLLITLAKNNNLFEVTEIKSYG